MIYVTISIIVKSFGLLLINISSMASLTENSRLDMMFWWVCFSKDSKNIPLYIDDDQCSRTYNPCWWLSKEAVEIRGRTNIHVPPIFTLWGLGMEIQFRFTSNIQNTLYNTSQEMYILANFNFLRFSAGHCGQTHWY